MGFLSNQVDRSQIKPGDHIYTYRAVFAYSHHGEEELKCLSDFVCLKRPTNSMYSYIPAFLLTNKKPNCTCFTADNVGIFVGGRKVVHFTRAENDSSNSNDGGSSLNSTCQAFPDCGFRQPDSGVVLSCLDCFLQNGSLYCFEYGVPPSVFLAKIRGGTCTIAASDVQDNVVHRAMYLLHNGFGNYDVFQNNCEDFAMYCKTGLVTVDRLGVGRSGQASSVFSAPIPALVSSLLMPGPVGVATVTAGMYCISRYATDIGVRTDVTKVAVEDLAINLGWVGGKEENAVNNDSDS